MSSTNDVVKDHLFLLEEDSALLGHVLNILRVVRETRDAVSNWFHVPHELVDDYVFKPGQFLTLAVPSDRTGWVARCYSIPSSPGVDELAVTVKRTFEGYGSNWLVDNARIGVRLRVLPTQWPLGAASAAGTTG